MLCSRGLLAKEEGGRVWVVARARREGGIGFRREEEEDTKKERAGFLNGEERGRQGFKGRNAGFEGGEKEREVGF